MPKKLPSDWVSTAKAAKELGVSVKTLWKWRREKNLKAGHHYRDISSPNAARPTYRWHLARLEKLFEARV